MADKSSQLVLDALGRAALDPAGVPLFRRKTAPGLFAGTAPARYAAQRCKEQNLLRVVRTETLGKTEQEVVAITPQGIDHLLQHASGLQILEDLVRVLEGQDKQLVEVVAAARKTHTSLEAIKALVQTVLERAAPSVDHSAGVMRRLDDWAGQNASEDCPLPQLYRRVPGLTIGQFHDALRQLQAAGRIYLHPWTGPLCEMPEPALALLAGHEIAYYASPRPA